MQPTVVEESEDVSPSQIAPGSVGAPMSTPVPTSFATPLKRPSKSSLHEEPVHLSPSMSKVSLHEEAVFVSPRTSKSSLHDTTVIPQARTSVSSLHEPLLAPTPQGPVTFMPPSLDQRLAETAQKDIPITSSPVPAAEVSFPQELMPPSRSPLGSPPLSPFLHQQMGSPLPQFVSYPQHYPFQYPQPFMASPHFPPAFYPTPFTSPAAPFPHSEDRAGSVGPEDERTRLLEKVSSVLPDINRLLHYYQESQGLLSEKDSLVKHVESQHMEEVARLRIELSVCKEEYEKIIGEQATENVKLKGELTELVEKIFLLEGSSHALTETHEEVNHLRLRSEAMARENDIGRSVNEQLATEKKTLEEELRKMKDQLLNERKDHEQARVALAQAHDKQVIAKEEEHAKLLSENKHGLSKMQIDLANLITKHTQQKKDLDFARATVSEHERLLTDKAKELADALRLHESELEKSHTAAEQRAEEHKREITMWSQDLSQSIARHEEEISQARAAHQSEIEEAQKAAEGHLSQARREHEQREAELQGTSNALRAELEVVRSNLEKERSAHHDAKTELASTKEDQDALKSKHEMASNHHAELAETMLSLRDKQAEWQRESERMDRILHNLGQLGFSKGKGDDFL